jgi:hypothetical protein
MAADEIDPPGESAEDEERRVPLRSTGDVQREMARVYRAARFKRIDPARANSLTQTLMNIGKLAEVNQDNELAKRVEALEAQLAAH